MKYIIDIPDYLPKELNTINLQKQFIELWSKEGFTGAILPIMPYLPNVVSLEDRVSKLESVVESDCKAATHIFLKNYWENAANGLQNKIDLRRQVLTEQWRATSEWIKNSTSKEYKEWHLINDSGMIVCASDYYCGCSSEAFWNPKQRFIHAPTRELAEELVNIWNGEWKPKENDLWCACAKDNYTHNWKEGDNLYSLKLFPYLSVGENSLYFPSVKQMNEFIERQKKKEPEIIEISKAAEYIKQKTESAPLTKSMLNKIRDLYGDMKSHFG